MKPRHQAAGLGLVIGLAAIGCAQERPPINRVQPDVLDKSFFIGPNLRDPSDDPVFYTRGYTSSQSYDLNTMWYGTASGLDRIRFEITENLLIARRAYQRAVGQDDKGLPGGEPNGTVVAAYKILSHFDIRRGYNPQTGEQTNVEEENTTDRPWYERQYMRVDWSTNQVADPMYVELLIGRWFGDPKITPMAYYVNDPNSEDAPYFDPEDGYFEVTNRFFVEPGQMEFSWGSLPSCVVYGLLTGTNVNDCNAQSLNIRLSFWKLKPDHDYEPLDNTRALDDVIHNFHINESLEVSYAAATQYWDPAYGYTDEGYHNFATVINIWEKSHADIPCTSNDDVAENNGAGDGTADECAGYVGAKGSQCDVFVKKCTIPYRDRQIKTVGWWVNKEMPEVYQDTLDANGMPTDRGAVEDIVYSWDQLFKPAAAFAREAECRRTGDGDRESCHNAYFKPEKVMVSYGNWLIDDPIDETHVFVTCHNPVRQYDDHDVCGPTGTKARTGDMRKFMLLDWPYATNAPFGGVTNINMDPVTGEAIGNTSLTVHIEQRAQRILDSLLVAIGDISLEDYMAGGTSERYAKVMSGPVHDKPLTDEELQRRIDAVNTVNLAKTGGVSTAGLSSDQLRARLQDVAKSKSELKADPELRLMQTLREDEMMAPLRGSNLETKLIDSRWMAGNGIDPSLPLDQSTLDMASPLRGLSAAKIQEIRQTMARRFAANTACFTPIEDGAQIGQIINVPLARYFMNKYGHLSQEERIAAMAKELRIESFKGVMLHEMGHAVGMRHQFSSSWDAMNFMPQYWQLRTAEGTAMESCKGQPRDTSVPNDTCMGPRYLDPLTLDEQGYDAEPRPSIEYFANTSTMEYQSERFSETSGLGTWDYANTVATYGRVLETMDPNVVPRDDPNALADQRRLATRMYSQLVDGDLVFDVVHADNPADENKYNKQIFGTDPFLATWHYTKVARGIKVFDPQRDCRDATEEEKAIGKWRIVHGKVCQPPPRDHAAWIDFRSDYNKEAEDTMVAWHTRPDLPGGAADLVRWSYRIGEMYAPSYVHTNMVDTGADAYEVAVNAIKHFDANYPMQYFRRANRMYTTMFIPSYVSEDYFELLRSYHWSAANTNLRYLEFGKNVFDILSADDNWNRPAYLANLEVFNALAKAVLVPQAGDYTLRPHDLSGTYDAANGVLSNPDFIVKVIDGRYVDEAYDRGPSAGGSWDYGNWVTRAGFYTEKAYAFLALADSRPTLRTIARDTYLDDRYVRLNFRNDLPEAFDRLLGGLLSEDWKALGMWVPGDTPAGQPATPQMLDLLSTTTPPARPAGAKILFPNVGQLQQLYAAIFSALYARDNTDMTLIHKMRIWVDGMEGNMSDAGFPKPEDQLRYYDPLSGQTYIARRFGTEQIDGRMVEKGIGSRMLQHANDLMAHSFVVQLDANNQPILDEYGRPTLVLDANGQPQPLDPTVSMRGELVRYMTVVDSVRQLGHILGQGPL
jgi:hypothetical protein